MPPAPVVTDALMARVQAEIAEPMLKGLARDGIPYQGVLYIGIMVTETGPKVVEFNARFGDPECQVLMAGLTGDIVPLLLVCSTGGLAGNEADYAGLLELESFRPTATVILANEGYPGSYAKGSLIKGVKDNPAQVFQAGTDC